MNGSVIKTLIAFFLLIVTTYYWLFALSRFWSDLSKTLEKGAKSVLVSDITDFEWDTVCLFHGYQSDLHIALEQAGLVTIPHRYQSEFEWIESTSDVSLIVFLLEDDIVYSSRLTRPIPVGGTSFSVFGDECLGSKASFSIENRTIYLTGERVENGNEH